MKLIQVKKKQTRNYVVQYSSHELKHQMEKKEQNDPIE